ncbi:MAG: SRPBCC family protein [Bacteroidota bacterium]
MKTLKLMLSFALFFVGLITTNAQNTDAIVTKTVVINASADDVWDRLRALDKIEELTPDFVGDSWVDGTVGIGAKRSCTAPGQTRKTAEQPAYTETVVAYDDEKRFYSYAVMGVPAKNMLNSFKVVDLGYKKCMVIWNSSGWTFMENPQMNEQQFLAFLDTVSDQLMARLYELHHEKS